MWGRSKLSTTEMKLPHSSLPADISPFLDKLVLDLYKLSKAATPKELKEKDSGLPDPIVTGRALSYLEYLGIIKRSGGKGVYELTDGGRKIGIELYQNNNAKADGIWKEILMNHPIYKHIQEYIKQKVGGVLGSTIGLAEYLKEIANEKWKTGFLKEGGKRLCNIFSAKGLLTYDTKEDSISIPSGIGAPTIPSQPPSQPLPQGPPTVPTLPAQAQLLTTTPSQALFDIDVELKIEVTKDTPSELADKIFNFLLSLSEKGVQIKSKEKES
jgi:hypothetical protein